MLLLDSYGAMKYLYFSIIYPLRNKSMTSFTTFIRFQYTALPISKKKIYMFLYISFLSPQISVAAFTCLVSHPRSTFSINHIKNNTKVTISYINLRSTIPNVFLNTINGGTCLVRIITPN